jgi:hydroxymethylglutaryl-CoA reductase
LIVVKSSFDYACTPCTQDLIRINMTSSRIPGFYNLSLAERHARAAEASNQTHETLAPWTTGGLSPESADPMIENVIGTHSLPLGLG